MIVVVVVTPYFLVYVNDRRPNSFRLEDVLHKGNTYINAYLLVDLLMAALVFAGVIQFIWPLRLDTFIIIRRALVIFGFTFLLRDITHTVTFLPDASNRCPKRDVTNTKWWPWDVFKFMLGGVTCGDMIFSGHTMALCTTTLIVDHYFQGWFRYVMWVGLVFIVFMIVLTRLHYTVDVILALIIFPLIWRLYHAIAEHPAAFSDELPWLVRKYFEKMEWNNPYFPHYSNVVSEETQQP